MRILGIDPGYATTGVGVIEKVGSKYKYLFHTAIVTKPKIAFIDRLEQVSNELTDIFKEFLPDVVAVEELFFNTNTTTAMKVAQARGVMLLTAVQQGVKVFDYTPPQVKSGVCGYGGADKKQVQYMVKKLLNLKETPKPDDAADALAIAICHGNSHFIKSL